MSSTARRPRERRAFSWKRCALWTAAALPVLLVAAYFAVLAWIESYLRSEDFRRFVSRATARTLKAEGEFAPLHFSGMNIHSDGFKARGSDAAAFASLALDQIRAELSLRRWRERVWQIDRIEAQRVNLQLAGSRVAAPPGEQRAAAPVAPSRSAFAGWLPNRVEIASAAIQEANLSWGTAAPDAGSLRRVNVAASQKDGAWEITAAGGRLEHGTFPAVDLIAARLLYRAPALIVQSAELRQGETGSLSVDGEVRFDDELDLHGKLAGIDITPLLSEDWRVRLHGKLSGEVRVRSALGNGAAAVISGTVQLSSGQLEALPVLNQLAEFTTLQQYRRLSLSRASVDFEQKGDKLRATNFVLESAGLIRIEGGFIVTGGQLDGTFQVGVTSSSLQWLPGSQERVFTEARAGYVWAPMRLHGPVASPGEDLSPRLIAAAKGAVIEKVENTVQSAIETGKGVIKGALDHLMPLFK